MDLKRLKQALREAGLQRLMLAGYSGRASFGIMSDPDNLRGFALVVHIEPGARVWSPQPVKVDEVPVKVVVRDDFVVPVLN